jgi:excisionase family DNA binding protein
VQPQLSPRGFPSIRALGTLVHGGLLLLLNPIFRSGEECRHSNLNSLQDIAFNKGVDAVANIKLLDMNDLSSYRRVYRSTIYRLPKNRKVPASRGGSDWLFNIEAVDQWHMEKTLLTEAQAGN